MNVYFILRATLFSLLIVSQIAIAQIVETPVQERDFQLVQKKSSAYCTGILNFRGAELYPYDNGDKMLTKHQSDNRHFCFGHIQYDVDSDRYLPTDPSAFPESSIAGNEINVAISSDERYMVTANNRGLFLYELISGQLIPKQYISRSNIDTDIVFSPDDTMIFAGGESSNVGRISVFSFDSSAGTASYIREYSSFDGIDGIFGRTGKFIQTDDNQFLYYISTGLSGGARSAIVVFSRTGSVFNPLSHIESMIGGMTPGVSDITTFSGPVLSEDEFNVYLRASQSVVAFSRDINTGVLTNIGRYTQGVNGIDGLVNLSGITVAPDGNHLYSRGRDQASMNLQTVKWQRTPISGELSYQGFENTSFPMVFVDNSERAITTDTPSAGIHELNRDPVTGELTLRVDSTELGVGRGTDNVVFIAISPDGRFLYTGYTEGIGIFEAIGSQGQLEYKSTHVPLFPLSATVRPLVVSPNGEYLLVAGVNSRIQVYRRNQQDGTLTHLVNADNGRAGDIVFSQDSQNVYALNGQIAGPTTIRTYDFDVVTGDIAQLQEIDASTLHPQGTSFSQSPRCLSTGEHCFAFQENANAIFLFDRSAVDGSLSVSSVYENTLPGFENLIRPTFLAIRPNDGNLYAFVEDGILTFDVSPATGEITVVDFLDVDTLGIINSRSFVIDPTGNSAVWFVNDGMLLFTLDWQTGQPHILQYGREQNEILREDIGPASGVVFAPRGDVIYKAYNVSNIINIYFRDKLLSDGYESF